MNSLSDGKINLVPVDAFTVIGLTATCAKVISLLRNPELKATVLDVAISDDPYLMYWMGIHLEGFGVSEERFRADPSPARLLGFNGVRNFACLMNIMTRIEKRHPHVIHDSKIDWNQAILLSYATRAFQIAEKLVPELQDDLYYAGFCFDRILLAAKKHYNATTLFSECVEEQFRHCMKAVRFCILLLKENDNGLSKKQVSLTILGTALHDIGKLVMDIFNPNPIHGSRRFREEMKQKGVPRELRYLFEKKQFGCTHDALSAALLQMDGVYPELSIPVLFHHSPYLLKDDGNTGDQVMAKLIALSSILAEGKFHKNSIGFEVEGIAISDGLWSEIEALSKE